MFLVSSAVFAQETKTYPSQELIDWGSGNFSEKWDLTRCDLTLQYTLDMSQIGVAGWAVTEVGLRGGGNANIDPNLAGGWMQSNYINGTPNPYSLNVNDFHFLSKHGWSDQQYDAQNPGTLAAPYWSNNNYGFWFDRDGVDPYQSSLWGASDGDTYNTGGVYDIVVNYHGIDANTATMFATINGIQQGLYTSGWKNAQPEFYPAGRSFAGDMDDMQVFYGRGGGGGKVGISDISATGCHPLAISGFYQPVDMGGTYNIVKGGSTVPMKFEIFDGAAELTDTTIVSVKAEPIACPDGDATTDIIETTMAGDTALRYDAAAGQFIYNWKTPKTAGCYKLTVTAVDGPAISANFILK